MGFRSDDATLIGRFTQNLQRLMDDRRGLLVALSGGADSSALLWLAVQAAPQLGIRVRACHVHHGLRGVEADEDAEACRRLCDRARVSCAVEYVQVEPEQIRRDGLESAARSVRHAALSAAADRDEWIALAHTLDDQAETVLLNLIRGSGPHGLGGMSERTGHLIRPLLTERRQTLRQYCTAEQIVWREDSTNADMSLMRNRVRLRIVPEMEAINPGFVEAAGRLSEIQRAESRWWSEHLDQLLSRSGCVWNRVAAVQRQALVVAGDVMGARLLLHLMDRAFGSHMHAEREHICLILEAARSGHPFALELPRGTGVARVQHDWVSLEARAAPPLLLQPAAQPQRLQIDDVTLRLAAGSPGVVRYPEPGDRVLQRGRWITVGEYLRQRGVPSPWRSRVPVVVLSGQQGVRVPDWSSTGEDIRLEPAPPVTPRQK